MIFARWRARRANLVLIDANSRRDRGRVPPPALYAALGAPDRVDGRFELFALHAGLVLRRLVALGRPRRADRAGSGRTPSSCISTTRCASRR